MPLRIIGLSEMGRRLPSLDTYIIVSVLLFAVTSRYAYKTVLDDEELRETILNVTRHLSLSSRLALADSLFFRVLCFSLLDTALIWVVMNSLCSSLAILGRLVVYLVFGRLRSQESSLLRDRLCQVMVFKLVFIFGVLSSNLVEELIVWALWIMAITPLTLLVHLSLCRLKYIQSSVANERGNGLGRLFILSVSCLLAVLGLTASSLMLTPFLGVNYAFFLFADASMLLLRSVHCTIRCGLALQQKSSSSSSVMDSSHSLVYHLDLAFDVAIDFLDLAHHFHMLLWAQIALSLICLLIFLQIRTIYQRLQSRIRRHSNYRRINAHIASTYSTATPTDLLKQGDDPCAICWESMISARKLNCGHLFHEWCLRGWLEQDATCPTCRIPLPLPVTDQAGAAGRGGRGAFNHFFHFNGRRYARWLPSFSVEVSHNLDTRALFRPPRRPIADSQLTRMAGQVQEMFPQLSMALILDDLRESGSAQSTIENILEGRVAVLMNHQEEDDEDEREEDDQFFDHNTDSEQSNGPSTSSSMPEMRAEPLSRSDLASMMDTTSATTSNGSRFSKSGEERESILDSRKRLLIETHRRLYVLSDRGADLRKMLNENSSVQSKNSTTRSRIRQNNT